jgi:purine-binding chemotaxis protein CheW
MTKNDHVTYSLDWQSIRESLAWDDEQQQALLLRARAAQYASPSRQQKATLPGASITVLIFLLGGEQYGIDVMLVRAIRGLPKVTPVPGVPHFYRGVVNLRGQLITVMDLQRFFNLPAPTLIPANAGELPYQELVIVQSNRLEIGLLTTQVQGLATLPLNTIQPIDSIRYARGVTAERLVILDIAALFEDERLIVGEHER